MKLYFYNDRGCIILPLLGAFFCCLLTGRLLSQDTTQEGARGAGRDVSLRYYGRDGLAKSAPKDTSTLRHVQIVYGTKLTANDVAFLSTLEHVEELLIGGNLSDEFVTIEGGLLPLAQMKGLRNVFLCKNQMCDKDLAFVPALSAIESLEFVGNTNPYAVDGPTVTDECAEFLRRATSLRSLYISGGEKLTDRFVSVIARDLKNLEHLDMDSELLTDQSLQVLANQCGNLRWLDLHSNQFTDEGVAYLANAKKMERLWVGSNALTDQCVKSVAGLDHLRHLELTVATIHDDSIQTLVRLPVLEILALRQPPLSDDQFAMFAHHPTLQSAFLNGRDLSATKVLEVIQTMPKLDHLDVGVNKSLQATVKRFLASRKAAP